MSRSSSPRSPSPPDVSSSLPTSLVAIATRFILSLHRAGASVMLAVHDSSAIFGVLRRESMVFADDLAHWSGFATLLGTAAATLMGLLFVAVSMNSRVVAEAVDKELRITAVNTFSGFLFLLMYALYMLIPDQTASTLGWSLLITAIFHFWILLRQTQTVWSGNNEESKLIRILWRHALPLGTAVFVGVVGALMIGGWQTDLYTLLYAFFTLLVGSTRNAWSLLMQLGSRRLEADARKARA